MNGTCQHITVYDEERMPACRCAAPAEWYVSTPDDTETETYRCDEHIDDLMASLRRRKVKYMMTNNPAWQMQQEQRAA